MSLQEYLQKEIEVAERCRDEYRPEFAAFAELAGFYERLTGIVKVAERRAYIPAELLLVVTNQMFGAGSQMLRTRDTDALALTRRAIEATASAYRMWEHPELVDVYVNAYPNHDKIGHPKQWERTKKAYKEFSMRNLFSPEGDVFAALKSLYSLASAMASHAGIGALAGHRDRNLQRIATFLGTDPRDTTNHWYTLIGAYMEMFKVFVRMMRGNAPTGAIDVLVKDFLNWRDRIAAAHADRAPWASQTAALFRHPRTF